MLDIVRGHRAWPLVPSFAESAHYPRRSPPCKSDVASVDERDALLMHLPPCLVPKRNVLVNSNGSAVLIDFGFSRLRFDESRSLTKIRSGGAIRFLAPELIMEDKFRTSEKSDVYAFGMLIYQLLYTVIPFYETEKEMSVTAVLMRGGSPSHAPLPAARASSSAWSSLDNELWSLLPLLWVEKEKRSELRDVHAKVCGFSLRAISSKVLNTLLGLWCSLRGKCVSRTPHRTSYCS